LTSALLRTACRYADTAVTLQDEKADVILKYMADEARNLKAYGELPENIRVNDADVFEEYEGDENDDIIEFDAIDDI
jgi:translation initiation factor 1A